MNKCSITLYVFLMYAAVSCTKQSEGKYYDYVDVLEGLKLNYTQYYDMMNDQHDFYFRFYANSISSKNEHDSLAARYKIAVSKFYNSDKKIIDYLLTFEHSSSYNQWLFIEKSPLSSNTKESDFIPEPEAALILIDYYLKGKYKPINVKRKPKTLTYDSFHKFYKLNKNKPLRQLRRLYRREF
jgi:hypothetical protein